MSSRGSPPSGADQGEGGHTGATQGAVLADLAYKVLGDTVPPHIRADSTTPSTCFALCDFNGCYNKFHFILWRYGQCMRPGHALTGGET